MLALMNGDIFMRLVPRGGRVDLPDGVVVMPATEMTLHDGYRLITHIPPVTPGPSPEERLASWRETAFLTRAVFLISAKAAGIISQAEAVEAAKGGMPETFMAILTEAVLGGALSEEEVENFEILWAALTQVDRLHPMLGLIAAAKGLNDAQLDTLFGWEG
ncbi:MAG: DUF935 domain-containing protein [Novosphingobium sp.]|nr:DUF935 domain-containing protein [Novosphingobium sp.]